MNRNLHVEQLNLNVGLRLFDHDVALSGYGPSMEMLKRGLRNGGNPDSIYCHQPEKSTALQLWALKGHCEGVGLLLKCGADTSIKDIHSRTALEYACAALNWAWKRSYAEKAIRLLFNYGATINSRSDLGNTPLMWAARAGNYTITKKLIELGADPGLKDNDGNKALYFAKNPGYKGAYNGKNRKLTINLLSEIK